MLQPAAGSLASLVFAAGIIGTGMLAVPVLGDSAAYAVGDALQARVRVEKKPHQAKLFYGVLAAATVVGLLLNLIGMNPMEALV